MKTPFVNFENFFNFEKKIKKILEINIRCFHNTPQMLEQNLIFYTNLRAQEKKITILNIHLFVSKLVSSKEYKIFMKTGFAKLNLSLLC